MVLLRMQLPFLQSKILSQKPEKSFPGLFNLPMFERIRMFQSSKKLLISRVFTCPDRFSTTISAKLFDPVESIRNRFFKKARLGLEGTYNRFFFMREDHDSRLCERSHNSRFFIMTKGRIIRIRLIVNPSYPLMNKHFRTQNNNPQNSILRAFA